MRIKLTDFLKREEKQEKLEIEKIIDDRKIKYLIHFTRIENLESILTNGFLPRKHMDAQKIQYQFNDTKRLDANLSANCFSVEYPNEFLFNKFKERYISNKWCILKLDVKKVILEHSGSKHYVNRNAGSVPEWMKEPFSKSPEAFKRLFLEENSDSRHKYTRTERNLKDYLPTNPQAEIVISDIINQYSINEIHFKTQDDFEAFKSQLKNQNLLTKFDFSVNDFYFDSRDNVIWEER